MTRTELTLRPHPWSQREYTRYVLSGQTLEQMLRSVAGMEDGEELAPLVVRINGRKVPAHLWRSVRPKHGTKIQAVPDTIHGDSAKQIIGAVVMIAVAWWAAAAMSALGTAGGSVFGLYGAAGYAAVGGVYLGATLATQALTKPPTPEAFGQMGGRWNQATGTGNQMTPWGPIPLVIGESRFFPQYAARPFTQSVGQESYLICMFDLGHGELEVSAPRIGAKTLESFGDAQWEVTRTPTLYRDSVSEEFVNATLEEFDSVTRTTAPDCEEISFDIVFGGGLFWRGTGKPVDGRLRVDFAFHYRPVGTTIWLPMPATARLSGIRGGLANWFVEASTRTPFAAGGRFGVPRGQYEFRIQRLAKTHPADPRNTYVEAATWTVLRSVRHTAPSTTGTTKFVLRIRSNDQVSGVLQTFSVHVAQKIRTYDRGTGTWSAPQRNCNAAWVVHWLMTQCPAFSAHAPDARMEMEDWADFAEFCTLHNLELRTVLDNRMSMRDLLRKLLAGAMASPGSRDGRYSVVWDHGDPGASMTFTPLEVDNFRSSRVFIDVPQALRVQFRNVDNDYQEDEIVVVSDGYAYNGKDARGNPSTEPQAETFETFRLEQAMKPQQAWQLARIYIAQGLYRQNTHTFDTDIAGLGTVRGDRVDVAHDVVEWGLGVGWVRAITEGVAPGAPGVATLKLDREVETEPGGAYGIQFRSAVGGKLVVMCTPHSPITDTFYLDTWPEGIDKGDAAVVGVRGEETQEVIITDVRYTENLGCSFTAVDYDPRVKPYWINPPVNIVSELTGRDYGAPEPPKVINVISAPVSDGQDDAGISTPEIIIGIQKPDQHHLLVVAR